MAVRLPNDVTAHALPIEGGTPIIRTDTDTLVLPLDRVQALALIAEISHMFAEEWCQGINLVIEGTEAVTHKQTHFEQAP